MDHSDHPGHHHHSHGHHHPDRLLQTGGAAEQALWLAFWLNLAFLAIEVGIGLWTNSLALLSDAGHMILDVVALAIALVAQRLARARPNGEYTFGLRRVPVLSAFGNGLTLLLICGVIVWEALHRLAAPPEVLPLPILFAGVAGLIVNLVSAAYLHRASKESLNIRGAFLHLLADALGSVGAILAAIIILATGWEPIDSVVSLVIVGLILVGTWPLLRDSSRVLLQKAPSGIDVGKLVAVLRAHPKVADARHVHVWEVDAGVVILTAVLLTQEAALPRLEEAANDLRRKLREQFSILHATFEWCSCGEDHHECRL
jgi:cobalt-zinc-cadmium efflux system protein